MKEKEFAQELRGKTLNLVTCIKEHSNWRELCQEVMDIVTDLGVDCSVVTSCSNHKLNVYEIYFHDDNSGRGQRTITYDDFRHMYHKFNSDTSNKVVCKLGDEVVTLEEIQYTEHGLGMKLYWVNDQGRTYVTNMKGELVQ